MTYVEARGAIALIAEVDVGRSYRAMQRKKDARWDASVAAVKADEAR